MALFLMAFARKNNSEARRLNGRGGGKGGEAAGKRAAEPPEVEEDDRANKRPRRATNSEPTYAGADSRSGTSMSQLRWLPVQDLSARLRRLPHAKRSEEERLRQNRNTC